MTGTGKPESQDSGFFSCIGKCYSFSFVHVAMKIVDSGVWIHNIMQKTTITCRDFKGVRRYNISIKRREDKGGKTNGRKNEKEKVICE